MATPMIEATPVAVVVDDDCDQLRILTELLMKEGLRVRPFGSAAAVLEGLNPQAPPALIVTGLCLPGIDGWRLCRLLRSPDFAPFNRVPILALSATFAGKEAARLAADLGASAFLASPVDGLQFGERVRALLRGERAPASLRVLIVEDDAVLAPILQQAFEAHGYRADTALTGREAEARFGAQEYEVVILDHHLPDTRGDHLLVAFRQQRPETVYLAITGDVRPDLALEWMKLGAAAFVRKPFAPEHLIEVCARARREQDLLQLEVGLEARTRELRQSEERFKNLASITTEGILIHEAGVILDANQAMADILGFPSPEDLIGKHGLEVSPFTPESLERLRDHIRTGSSEAYEIEIAHPSGRLIPAETSGRPIRYQGRAARLVYLRDLTERKRAEAERERLQAQLSQAQKMESVGRLAGGMAHDSNNMLQVILGNAALALEDLPADSPWRENLEEIQKCAQRSADLTRQLLAFARKQTIAPRVIDLNATVAGMLNMLRRLIGENIDLTWQPAADLWALRIDPSQLDQVLANLCVNARDAIRENGHITIETGNVRFDEAYQAAHPGLVSADYVWLVVRDNGEGMDPEVMTHLFEPFFTTKPVGQGTGLGLATVYGIVKQNRGFIEVDSTPGQGTAFKIYLPRHLAKAEQGQAEVAPAPVGRGKGTILLVEDEAAILRIGKRMLEGLGYTVLSATTPGEAIRLAEDHVGEIDLLMTDVVMPEMNGRELAKRLLSLYPQLKRLFMSGYPADVIANHGVLDEGFCFLQKPFSTGDLADKVRAALER